MSLSVALKLVWTGGAAYGTNGVPMSWRPVLSCAACGMSKVGDFDADGRHVTFAPDPVPAGGRLRWVRRNEDKPHRCPRCHRVVTWEREEYGPRTRLTCPPCGVQWRSGVRVYPWPLRALRRR